MSGALDGADRIIVGHIIFQTVGKQGRLPQLFPQNETTHSAPPQRIHSNISMRFHTASVESTHFWSHGRQVCDASRATAPCSALDLLSVRTSSTSIPR